VGEYVGGYTDWLRQRRTPASANLSSRLVRDTGNSERVAAPPAPTPAPAAKRRLSFKEQKELEQLPATIERLEAQVAKLTDAMNEPSFYQRESTAIVAHNTELAKAQSELDTAYVRWAELDAG